MEANLIVLLQLILAHILTDFVFQPTAMVMHKRRYKIGSWALYVHVFIAGLTTYLLLQDWTEWMIPVFITTTHFGIDLWKLYMPKDNLRYFLIDQCLHGLMILLAWLLIIDGFGAILPNVHLLLSSHGALAIIVGYLIVIFPVGFLIGKATERWQIQLDNDEVQATSLRQAGRYIGVFERILILTLMLINQFAAIGFLIGAKSILRFTETKGARKQTEYVLIGTLMSFSICILVGLCVQWVLTHGI